MDQNSELSQVDSTLVDAYLRHHATRDESLMWAFSELHHITSSDPEHAWRITLALVERASGAASLAYVAAGPLEDLLYARGDQFIDRAEALSKHNQKFREALSYVYNESTREGDVAARRLG